MGRRFPKTVLAFARLRIAIADWRLNIAESRLAEAKACARAAKHQEFKALLRLVVAEQRLIVLRAELGGDHAA